MLFAILMVQLIGNLKAFANSSDLIGQPVVCNRVRGVIGSTSGIGGEYKDGYLIIKNAHYSMQGGYYFTADEADPKSCKIITRQPGEF